MPYSHIKFTEDLEAKSLTVNQPSNSVNLNANGQTLTIVNDVNIDAGGMFQFYDVENDSYDMNNGGIVVGDSLTLRGSAVEDLEINNLDFDTDDGVAYYCNVYDSQNTGAVDIDATDSTNTNSGGNTGWIFSLTGAVDLLNIILELAVVGTIASTITTAVRNINLFKSNIFNSLLFKR